VVVKRLVFKGFGYQAMAKVNDTYETGFGCSKAMALRGGAIICGIIIIIEERIKLP